ncbi:MAG: beta-galactosidase [Pseudomonadota bacterium]
MTVQPVLGVCYYPEHWPSDNWAGDAERMRALGIRWVRIGEFAWSRIEPLPGRLDWAWLDEAIDTLASHGLEIILGTPTACPPKWLVDASPSILAVDAEGRPRGFGSRRHYCFSSMAYRIEARRITAAVAERYASHPAIVAWQVDNEYGCHDTVESYSLDARVLFRGWLDERYPGIEALNEAWGNVFWSMEYTSFEQIDPPVGAVTETNPAHRLAWQRFCSDQVADFNRDQVRVLKEHGVTVDITHNYMGHFTAFDHFDVADDLDVASWDSYPLGFLDAFEQDEARVAAYRQQGDPDTAAFHHDLYRAVGRGRWWVMEQQPGPVNWAAANAAPLPGMPRLWALEAFAHGAELVSFFRWRQAPFAQEQNHAGVLLPNGEDAPLASELRQLAEDMAAIDWDGTGRARVALVFAYDATWVTDIQPQAAGFSALGQMRAWYRAARRLGADIDIVPPTANLDGYDLVLLPCLPIVTDDLASRLQQASAVRVVGPRSGSRTDDFRIPETQPPGALQALLPLSLVQIDSIRDGVTVPAMAGDLQGHIHTWLEHVDTLLTPQAATDDGKGVWFVHERTHYLTACLSDTLLDAVIGYAFDQAGIPAQTLPPGVRTRRRGGLCFAFNYANEARTLPGAIDNFLAGGAVMPPASVSIWRED